MSSTLEKYKYTLLYDLVIPFFRIYELLAWQTKGRLPPTPHLTKQQMVLRYAAEIGAKEFVETGTYLGAMVQAVKHYFKKVYSIELEPKLYRWAKRKFCNVANIHLFQGDSSKVLVKLLHKVNTPAVFWLDAHYSGGISAKGAMYTPVLAELQAIFNADLVDFVVLIDDADLFVGDNNYPKIKAVKALVAKSNQKYNLHVENNIIVIKQLD